MDLLANCTRLLRQIIFNAGMDIFVCWLDHELADLFELQDMVECLLERVQFLGCKDANMLKHSHMCKRSPHIVANQTCIEDTILGSLKALHLGIGGVAFLPELCH